MPVKIRMICAGIISLWHSSHDVRAEDFVRLRYNNPGLVVDLGVGLYAWPLPMDFDGDGVLDIVVSSPDAIKNSLTIFRNPGNSSPLPTFQSGRHLAPTVPNLQVSFVEGKRRVLGPNVEYTNFLTQFLARPLSLSLRANIHDKPVRANQWKYVDFDADGALDLMVGVEDWTDYGWDDAFDSKGTWTRGPLRGYVYLLKNMGSNTEPSYASPLKLEAADGVIDVYGTVNLNR